MKVNFDSTKVEGDEVIMDTSGMNISEIRFHLKSRQIILEVEGSKFGNLDELSWQALKKLVTENGGTWTNTADAKAFLSNL